MVSQISGKIPGTEPEGRPHPVYLFTGPAVAVDKSLQQGFQSISGILSSLQPFRRIRLPECGMIYLISGTAGAVVASQHFPQKHRIAQLGLGRKNAFLMSLHLRRPHIRVDGYDLFPVSAASGQIS